ncbi:MAG: hypothetical protein SOU48_08470, partial [Prevotella sp.]|nr:hypothetical protein [Prevotella sp.]
MKNEDPLLSPCKGEAIYVLRLAVSQLRQRDFSLFTFHSSLFTKRNVTSILHSSLFILHLKPPMYALIDCNSFFCSVEKVF